MNVARRSVRVAASPLCRCCLCCSMQPCTGAR